MRAGEGVPFENPTTYTDAPQKCVRASSHRKLHTLNAFIRDWQILGKGWLLIQAMPLFNVDISYIRLTKIERN